MTTLEFILAKFKPIPNPGDRLIIGDINRTIMAQTLYDFDCKEGAEIGVAEGIHAEILCRENPGVKLHCVDIWEQYPGYEEYSNIEEVYQEAIKRLKPYKVVFHKEFSMKALRHFEDESLDFVYIDGAHNFVNVAMDVSEWAKKVRPGGIVFGHDYKFHGAYLDKGRQRHPVHVKPVVDAYVMAHNIKPFFVLENNIKDPTFGRDNPGWMFVK